MYIRKHFADIVLLISDSGPAVFYAAGASLPAHPHIRQSVKTYLVRH